MPDVLIAYSTTDGHTRQIAERLRAVVEQHGHRVTVANIGEEHDIELESFDKIVLGASIRYGKHHKRVYRFIEQHLPLLDSKPNAFFSVNVVARKPAKRTAETNPYLRKFLKQIPWQPLRVEVFAGKIDYPKYGFFDRQMIRLIMWMTKGPTDPSATVEFTDWEQVEAFGHAIGRM